MHQPYKMIILFSHTERAVCLQTTNQNSLFRSRDWLSANQGPVYSVVSVCCPHSSHAMLYSLHVYLTNGKSLEGAATPSFALPRHPATRACSICQGKSSKAQLCNRLETLYDARRP
eukprot:sb/3476635/